MQRGRATTRRSVAIAIAALALLATAPPAGGATQLGATFSPSGGCSDRDVLQTGAPELQYTAPFAGVITSWSHQASSPTDFVRFKVARPVGGDSFTIIAVSELKLPLPGELNTYTDIRIPVRPGDVIGGHFFGLALCSRPSGAYDHHFSGVGEDRGIGTTTFGSASGSQYDLSATLEPDADGDGFGDETQDGCLTDPSKQVDCYPPETQITNGPKDKTKKKQVTFEFGSDDPGATFECSIDDAGFSACVSPLIDKVGKGKHSFQVRSRDAAGNVDGSPAVDSWKVKKKKR